MPIFYAHHHFGEQVYKELPEELQEIIYEYYPQFQIGLQGPDIFFFFRSSDSWQSHFNSSGSLALNTSTIIEYLKSIVCISASSDM